MKFKKIPHEYISNTIAFLSLVAVVINFVCDGKRNEDDKKQTDRITSISIQPRLKLDTLPRIDLAYFVRNKQTNVKYDSVVDKNGIPVGYIEGELSIKMTLRFKNVGNYLAKPAGMVYVDTAGMGERLRKLVLSTTPQIDSTNVKELNKHSDILPGDTISFTFDIKLMSFDRLADTLHYLLLYQNELGNYYDTYVWIPLKTAEIKFYYGRIPGTDSVFTAQTPSRLDDLVKLSGKSIETYNTYSSDEAVLLNKLNQSLQKYIR